MRKPLKITQNFCSDCKDGEHDDYDNDIEMTAVMDDNLKVIKRTYLCSEHREMYLDDGYTLHTY